jgi:hypothetical protein
MGALSKEDYYSISNRYYAEKALVEQKLYEIKI